MQQSRWYITCIRRVPDRGRLTYLVALESFLRLIIDNDREYKPRRKYQRRTVIYKETQINDLSVHVFCNVYADVVRVSTSRWTLRTWLWKLMSTADGTIRSSRYVGNASKTWGNEVEFMQDFFLTETDHVVRNTWPRCWSKYSFQSDFTDKRACACAVHEKVIYCYDLFLDWFNVDNFYCFFSKNI